MLKRVIVFGGVLVSMSVGTTLFLSGIENRNVEAEFSVLTTDIVQDVSLYTPLFLEDQAVLSVNSWLRDVPCNADAGALLNPMINWDTVASKQWLSEHPSLRPDWDAIEDLWAEVENFEVEFGKPLPPGLPDLDGIDLSFLKELRAFDCWNIDQNSPLADFEDADWSVVATEPHPSYKDLMVASELRLLQGMQGGEAEMALDEVSHLARLLLSTEDMVGIMVSRRLLTDEREMTMGLQASGIVMEARSILSEEELDRMQRVVFAWQAYTSVTTPEEFRQVVLSSKPMFGRCAGINTGLHRSLAFQHMIEDDAFHWLESVLENTPECRLTRLRRRWGNPKYHLRNDRLAFCASSVGEYDASCVGIPPRMLPSFMQEGLAKQLLLVAGPYPFAGYEE